MNGATKCTMEQGLSQSAKNRIPRMDPHNKYRVGQTNRTSISQHRNDRRYKFRVSLKIVPMTTWSRMRIVEQLPMWTRRRTQDMIPKTRDYSQENHRMSALVALNMLMNKARL